MGFFASVFASLLNPFLILGCIAISAVCFVSFRPRVAAFIGVISASLFALFLGLWSVEDGINRYADFDPEYNPWFDVQGTEYEDYFARFMWSESAKDTAAIKRNIDNELRDCRVVLSNNPIFKLVRSHWYDFESKMKIEYEYGLNRITSNRMTVLKACEMNSMLARVLAAIFIVLAVPGVWWITRRK